MAVMSFQRKVLILGVCIGVLAVAYVLGLLFSPARIGQREAETPLIPRFDRQQRDRVAEIRISADQGSLELVRMGDAWVLPGEDGDYPASQSRIDGFLDFLAGTNRSRVITDNPDVWEEFEVHTGAARRIRLLDSSGNELSEIIIGKPSAGGGNEYVRLGGANDVVLSNRSFDYYLNVEERFWSYLRILPEGLDGQSIMRISVDSLLAFDEGGDQPVRYAQPVRYTLVLGGEQPAVWKLVDRPTGDLDSEKVDRLANNLADLEGNRFAHGVTAAGAGLSDPAATVLISTEDGRDFRLLVGSEAGEDQYYVSLENGDFVYLVSEWRVKGILRSVEDLRTESEAGEQ